MRTLEQIWRDWIDNPQYKEKQYEIFLEINKHRPSKMRDIMANLVIKEEVLDDLGLLFQITGENFSQNDIDELLDGKATEDEKKEMKIEKAKSYLDDLNFIYQTKNIVKYIVETENNFFKADENLKCLIDFLLNPTKRLKFVFTNIDYCLFLINQEMIEANKNFIKLISNTEDKLYLQKVRVYEQRTNKAIKILEKLYDNHRKTFEDYYDLKLISDFQKYFKTLKFKDYNFLEKREHEKYLKEIIENNKSTVKSSEITEAIVTITNDFLRDNNLIISELDNQDYDALDKIIKYKVNKLEKRLL